MTEPIIITGMHRSGTSLVANLLRQCGLWLGEEKEMHGATADNPDGHWERVAVTELNDVLLNELGGGWDDVPEFPSRWHEKCPSLRERAAEIHWQLARPTPWGWKDPRASLLMPFWLAVVPDARVVICLRNPLEVAHSLRRRGLMSWTLGLKLWRDYNEHLLSDVPRQQRIVVHYEHFFTQPSKTLRRLADLCGLKVSEAELNKILATAKPELRHIRFDAEQLARVYVASEIIALYARLCQEGGFTDTPKHFSVCAQTPKLLDLAALDHEIFLRRWSWTVRQRTPDGARVAVVSKGDDDLLRITRREAWHFPGDKQGRYTGYHPTDDAEAIEQLAAVRDAGAQFLALPRSSLWWLECYPGFRRHLETHFTQLETDEKICFIYQLKHIGQTK